MVSIGRLVQDDLLSQLAGVGVDVRVAWQRARVDDGHVQALRNGIVEEDAVHGIAQGVQASEGEGQVAQAARERHARAGALDLSNCVDEVNGVAVMLRQACSDRQHVAIKDDVLRREIKLLAQQLVAALADPDLVLKRGSLALLVECHDHHCSSVAHACISMFQELLLTRLQGDRVHNALALHALQAFLHHRPLGRVNHERKSGNCRLRYTQLHELAHGRLAVDEVRVKVEVQNVGLLLALGDAYLQGLVPFVSVNQLLELSRAHEVASLAHPLEASVLVNLPRLQTGQHHGGVLGQLGKLSHRAVLNLLAHSRDVGGESAAAAAHEI